MTLLEFNQLTGANLTEDQYKPVEEMYMNAGNMDKQEFCAEWAKHNSSKLLNMFYTQSCKLRDKKDDLKDQIWDLAEFILDQAEELGSDKLTAKVIEMVGVKRYLKLKLEKGYDLSDTDRQELINIINTDKIK